MNKLIEFNVPGGTVVVESHEEATGSPVRGGSLARITETAGKSLEDTLSVIRPVADAALAACRDLVASPAEVEVEFSLKFDAEVGVVIARAKTEGSLRVKVAWKPA
jgi:phosphoribosylaminoimidazole carboxylase (NCAIR synthetase)